MTPETDQLNKFLGLPAQEAEERLRALGFETIRRDYSSKRGVEGADSERVVRLRPLGDNGIEMLVSRFKTSIQDS